MVKDPGNKRVIFKINKEIQYFLVGTTFSVPKLVKYTNKDR